MKEKEFWQKLLKEMITDGLISIDESLVVMRHLGMEVET